MRNQLQLPVDFMVLRSTDHSVENEADSRGLVIKRDGFFYIGEVRLGLSFFLNEGESFISPLQIEMRADEKNAAGSSIWKHFMKDLERNIPEAWDYNLYFGTFLFPKNSNDSQDKYMFYLKKCSNGKRYEPMFRLVSTNFNPRGNDRLVCIVY